MNKIMIEDIFKTAHIHLEYAVFRIHVKDANVFPINAMENFKPKFVDSISRSNDPEQKEQSILVHVSGEYDLVQLAEWINIYDI